MYRYLLFDLDGTLTDPAEGITKCVAYALEHFGITAEPETLTSFIGPPLLDQFMSYAGFDRETAITAIEKYRERFRVIGIFENRVLDGIPELLRDLRAAGKTLAVATSKPEAFSVRILERFGLAQYFHHIGGASFDTSRSTKSAVVAYSLGLCGNPDPETVVMVGDRKHDVEGAINNGLQSIGVLYGYGDRPELEDEGATVIAESVEQLRNILLG